MSYTLPEPRPLRLHPRPVCLVLVLLLLVGLWPASAAAKPKPEVLTEGAITRGANGLRFDAADRLYVASFLGREIVIVDRESGAVDERIPRLGETPDDLVFGPDGSLYWTSLLTGTVTRRTPAGELATQAVGSSPNPIAFSADGRLFVAECLGQGGDGLYELDPELEDAPRLITDELGSGCAVNGMDFGADGELYGPRWFAGDVVRIDVDSGDFEVVADGFVTPAAVKLAPSGELVVVDFGDGRVWSVDGASGARALLAELTPGIDNLDFDSSGRLFVSHGIDGEIVEVEPGGVRVVAPGGLVAPGGAALVGGSLWIADSYQLAEIDPASGEVLRLVQSGTALAQTVAADGEDLLLTSWLQNRVQIWDPVSGEVELDLFDFAIPMNALRFGGDLIVAEALTGAVVRADGDDPAQRTTIAGGFGLPAGLATDGDSLWVADWASGEIWRLAADGEILAEPELVVSGLAAPEGLAVSDKGHLLVVEPGAGRLLRIHRESKKVKVLADGLAIGVPPLPGLIPTWFFNGLAVAPDGTIYLSGAADRVVYRLKRGS